MSFKKAFQKTAMSPPLPNAAKKLNTGAGDFLKRLEGRFGGFKYKDSLPRKAESSAATPTIRYADPALNKAKK